MKQTDLLSEQIQENEKEIDDFFERHLHIKIRHLLRAIWIIGVVMSIVGLVLYWGTPYMRGFVYIMLPLGLFGLLDILWDSILSHGKDTK
ncbi:hypothetical protein SAMN05216383_11341 [Prevotella sp. KH2C16]|nr:hypothetical protein SAMN05216383_11341 [Prevotella sp. KH2C16]